MLLSPSAPVPDAAARALFFAHLSETADVSAAAARAGLSRSAVRQWRAQDADFAHGWSEAIAQARETLELQLLARAISGEQRTLYYGGKPVGEQVEYNDSLAMFFLRAYLPHTYGTQKETRALPARAEAVAAQIEIEKRLDAIAARMAAQELRNP